MLAALRAKATPPRVFWQKSLDLIDSKEVEFFASDKEFVRVSEIRS
jgi:hypothetical protein